MKAWSITGLIIPPGGYTEDVKSQRQREDWQQIVLSAGTVYNRV